MIVYSDRRTWPKWLRELRDSCRTDKAVRAITPVIEKVIAALNMENEFFEMQKALVHVGFCHKCMCEITHDEKEPFASCKCVGTIEWTEPIPLIHKLRKDLARCDLAR